MDPDFEHAGVGITINKKWMNNITEVKEVSGRIMTMKLASATGGITFISVYAPPADHKTREKKKLYDDLLNRRNQRHRGNILH